MRLPCGDCGVETWPHEYYMVEDDLWERVVGWRECGETEVYGPGAGFLCVGCLEVRLGRELLPGDFIDAPVNVGRKSERLERRMGRCR